MSYPEYEMQPAGHRRRVSQMMALSKTHWPYAKTHAYGALDIDLASLEDIRSERKDIFLKKWKAKLRIDVFFAWWMLRAAEKWPILNSCYEVKTEENEKQTEYIRLYKSVNLGISVAHPRQLITFAIREAEKKSFSELAILIESIYKMAHVDNVAKALPEGVEIGTSTMTFNNVGALGSEYGLSIIEPGASLILTLHKARHEVRWDPNAKPFNVECLRFQRSAFTAIAFDHRVFDGVETTNLLTFMKERVENTEDNKMLLL